MGAFRAYLGEYDFLMSKLTWREERVIRTERHHGSSYREIARIHHISHATVYRLLLKAGRAGAVVRHCWCAWCHQPFEALPQAKFCSDACRNRHWKANRRKEQR